MLKLLFLLALLPVTGFSGSAGFTSFFNNQPAHYHLDTAWIGLQVQGEKGYQVLMKKMAGDKRLIASEGSEYLKKHQQVIFRVRSGSDHARILSEVQAAKLATHLPVYRIDNQISLAATPYFIIQLTADASQSEFESLNEQLQVSVVKRLKYMENGWLLKTDSGRDSVPIVKEYGQSDIVAFVGPQFLYRIKPLFVPNDTHYPLLWHLQGTGQKFEYQLKYGGYTSTNDASTVSGAGVDAEKAWNISRGSENVIIAIMDTGCDLNHEDFAGKYVGGYDFEKKDSDPSPGTDIEDAHGTACAGVAAATGHNGIGTVGLCMKCKIMPLKLFKGTSSGSYTLEDDAADAFRWAADNGAWIVSNSWGLTDQNGADVGSYTVAQGMNYAYTKGRGGKGTVILFASGNGNPSTGYGVKNPEDSLCFSESAICVGASNGDNKRSSYSNYGVGLDLLAPSSDFDLNSMYGYFMAQIITTDLMGRNGMNNAGKNNMYSDQGMVMTDIDTAGNYTYYFGGTSASCPLAAGLAGLILSVNSALTAAEVRAVMNQTTDKIETQAAAYNQDGFSEKYGYGKINAFKALRLSTGCYNSHGDNAYVKSVGEQCSSDCECQGAKCLTGMEGGYCSFGCEEANCLTGSICYEGLVSQYGKICLKSCNQDGDCRQGYKCQEENGQKFCLDSADADNDDNNDNGGSGSSSCHFVAGTSLTDCLTGPVFILALLFFWGLRRRNRRLTFQG